MPYWEGKLESRTHNSIPHPLLHRGHQGLMVNGWASGEISRLCLGGQVSEVIEMCVGIKGTAWDEVTQELVKQISIGVRISISKDIR